MIKLFTLKQQKKDGEQKGSGGQQKKASAAQLRIQKDFPDPDDLLNFKLIISPDEGFYRDGRFVFNFRVGSNYPHEPPKVKCATQVYHPNIDLEGNVCLNILREDWNPEPNPEDPLNKEAADVLQTNRRQFEYNVKKAMRGGYVGETYFECCLHKGRTDHFNQRSCEWGLWEGSWTLPGVGSCSRCRRLLGLVAVGQSISIQDHETGLLSRSPAGGEATDRGIHAPTGVVSGHRSAFYALAKRYHPDSTHSEQKLKHFQELSNAYNILTDETKRLEYDQLGGIKDERAFLEQAGNPMNVDLEEAKKFDSDKTANDDINKLKNNEFDLQLDFLEATVGCKKRVELRYLRKCETCKGKSQLMAHRDVGKEPCRRCNGTGKVTTKTATFSSVNTCTQCKGKRFTNRNDCETCSNRGFVVSSVDVMVPVPSGSRDGDVLSLVNPATKQQVTYRLTVPGSDYFRRVGNDIQTDKQLNISEAILGGTFQVRGLYESLELRVEPGTQSHTQVLLKGKGVRSKEGVGHHIVTLKVRIPRNLSVKQRQLVLALSQAEDPVFEPKAKSKEAAGLSP
ncbi:hypothetical protein M5D96_006293 [Drosophila gunungcola]|uniref:E2 NEDD8-conjugating enzyme n=1 Tax=Drosophila gunungcola TaxID=103775 RepID=A0A9P9YNQ0_9MUSC|nr:hypothetical protein M5D96_006293 [Drosophila gunungcola]